MALEFDSLHEYICQTYHVNLPDEYVVANSKPLAYMKLIRALTHTELDTYRMTAEMLFSSAVQAERLDIYGTQRSTAAMFVLADIHEDIEVMIRKYKGNGGSYVDDINS